MPLTLAADLDRCAAALSGLQNNVVEVGRLLAAMTHRHPRFLDALAVRVPSVSRSFLRRLERVGRRELDPRIAMGVEHGILLERLSLADQRRVLDAGVEVAVGEGGADTMVLRADQMDATTAARVLVRGTVASIPAQRSAILAQEDANRRVQTATARALDAERRRTRRALAKLPLTFHADKSVTVERRTRLTATVLAMILAECER